jgi:hypothetical protein
MSRNATKPHNFILEPDQSRAEYNRLRKQWDAKLEQTGFKDIEQMDSHGHVSCYSRDYSLARLGNNYSEDKAEYYRRAGIFLQEYNFNLLRKQVNPIMARFIWAHYAAGYTMRDIESVLKRRSKALLPGPLPRKRTIKGPQMAPASLFFIFKTINKVLYPAFQAWSKQELNGLLACDIDLSF